jgi:hypothetical protein
MNPRVVAITAAVAIALAGAPFALAHEMSGMSGMGMRRSGAGRFSRRDDRDDGA